MKVSFFDESVCHRFLRKQGDYKGFIFMGVCFLTIKAIFYFFSGFIIVILHRFCVSCCQFSVSKPEFIGLSSKTIGHEYGIPHFWCVSRFTWKTSVLMAKRHGMRPTVAEQWTSQMVYWRLCSWSMKNNAEDNGVLPTKFFLY